MTLASSTASMNVAEAQRDMRFAYMGGAPGLLASGTAWMVAGLVALNFSVTNAIYALFIGGMFIHPAAVLLSKALGRTGAHTRGNPLGMLALESTVLMLLCMPLAYGVSLLKIEWFFPAMLLVIGGRYLTFATLYGMRMYWACGAVLAMSAYWLLVAKLPPHMIALSGAAIEVVFAIIVFNAVRKESRA